LSYIDWKYAIAVTVLDVITQIVQYRQKGLTVSAFDVYEQ